MSVPETKQAPPLLLNFNAGYLDTAGFLALRGLFTAHVTGNFVTLGAALALGTSGAIAKLLALPVFCAVVIAIRLLDTLLSQQRRPVLETLLVVQVALLIVGAALAITLSPFHDIDGWRAVLTGMVLVSAMAIQNAFHRMHFGSAPPSTMMTGTTTQVMIDLADRVYESRQVDGRGGSRLVPMATAVLFFGAGCGAAALSYHVFGVGCFVIPPIVASLALILWLGRRRRLAWQPRGPL